MDQHLNLQKQRRVGAERERERERLEAEIPVERRKAKFGSSQSGCRIGGAGSERSVVS